MRFGLSKKYGGFRMDKKESRYTDKTLQPQQYTTAEIAKLKEFINIVQNDEARSALACWGNHSDYSHGY